MQNKKTIRNFLIWFILGLFAISGLMQGNFFGINNPVVAIVGKKKIRVSDVRKYMALIQVPEHMDRNNEQVQNYIFMKALALIKQRTLITLECERLGFVVSDEKVAETIRKQPQFCVAGEFSRSLFLAELGKLGMSEMEYKYIIKEHLLHKQWFFMLESSYIVPDHVVNAIAQSHLQKRSFKFMEIPYSSVKLPKITDNVLSVYYKSNPNLFREKAKKIYKIFVLEDKNLAKKIEFALRRQKFDQIVKDYDLKTYYSNNLTKIDVGVRRELQNLTNELKISLHDNSSLYFLDNKFYAFKLIKIESGFVPDFTAIKDNVKKMYIKDYIKRNIRPNNKWIEFVDIKLGESCIGVPDFVVRSVFLNQVGEMCCYDNEDARYYIKVYKITKVNLSRFDLDEARKSVSSNILDEVIQASMYSLSLRYKMQDRL